MKTLNVNFVKLFKYALSKIAKAPSLSFRDVALYYSILQCWNKYRFPEYFSINRQELMTFSKIGSNNTYLRALHSLQDHGLIIYYPSKDPSLGSKIFVCIDDSVLSQNLTLPRHNVDTKVRSSLNNSKQEKTLQIPKKNEVIDFFNENGSNENLATQFFNHNNGLNWMYNGSAIMNWKSFAVNYIDQNNKRSLKNKSKGSADGTSDVSHNNNFGSFKN